MWDSYTTNKVSSSLLHRFCLLVSVGIEICTGKWDLGLVVAAVNERKQAFICFRNCGELVLSFMGLIHGNLSSAI